ncbi:unnamed protein product, partial [Brenthis ino]
MNYENDITFSEYLCRCKCCLNDNDLKSLWEVYECDDGTEEIYGQMVVDCFALPWYPTDEPEHICEFCVLKLREALSFKKNILAVEDVLLNDVKFKEEAEPQIDTEDENPVVVKYVPIEDEYQHVEYLEVEEAQEDKLQMRKLTEFDNTSSGPSTPGASNASLQRKWPKKKKKHELTKLYKQYTQNDLKEAIKAVTNGVMTCTSAATKYGIPKKTLTVKVNSYVDRERVGQTEDSNDKHYKLIEEIKLLLTHTTAVPFKTKTTRYYCFYCSTDGRNFEDTDELREHTRAKHSHEWTKIEMYMRPQWLNEVIKLDVEDLHCKICLTMLPDWNNLFVHLGVNHDLEFDMAYTRIIPYALSSDLKCFLCKQNFHNFGHLDSHMNNHYSNYICYECGDTFLSASRLDKHLNVHKIGNHPCDYCEKVFKLEKYKAKHVSLVHIQESTVKCLYCSEKFVGIFQRHIHVTEHHKEKVKYMTCEYCGNSYTWKPYFLAHMRRKHGAEKKYKCKHCEKCFLMKYELKNHMVRHTGEKNFICGLCGLGFTRMVGLKRHCQNDHREDLTVYGYPDLSFVVIRVKTKFAGEDGLKDLWTEYHSQGERRIYGEMINYCFSLNWEQPSINSDSDSEHICKICISKLHDAVNFKKEILLSAQLLLEEIKNESYAVKMEDDSDTDIETEYLNIEFLEDDDIGKEKSDIKIESPTKPIQEELFMNQKSKKYTEEDFKKCLEGVKSKTLSQSKASLLYNIPRRTIRSALDSIEMNPTKEIDNELYLNPASEYFRENDLKKCVKEVQNKTLSQNKPSKLFKISRRVIRIPLEKTSPLDESIKFTEKESIQRDAKIKDSDDNKIDSPERDESFNVPRKKTKRYTEADVQKCVEAVQSKTLSQCKAAILYNVPRKAIQSALKKMPPLDESISIKEKEDKQKEEETTDSDDNTTDSPETDVPSRKIKRYTEADVQKCVEAVQSKRLSQCKASILYNVPRQAIHIALVRLKLASSSNPMELITAQKSKKYTEEDFKKCLEAVKNKTMSRGQACTIYNVPKSSLHAAIEIYFDDAERKTDVQKAQDNVDCVIKYTNATPLRGFHRAGYACVFCPMRCEKPADLKKHTLKTHSKLRAKVSKHRIVKLDVTGLKCKICDEKIETLESILEHLSYVHGKKIFTGIRDFFIPFKFESEALECAVCSETFHSFKPLNDHMNWNHYKNFECDECGRGFISKHSLRAHSLRHETGVFKCKFCPKVFSSKVRSNAHERTVHIYNNYLYTCGYCSERFSNLSKKKQHEVSKHNAAPTLYNCQACSKSYLDLRTLRNHIRAFHLMQRPHRCAKCDFSAYTPYDLKKHMIKHTGDRNFTCDICSKSYGMRTTLREHMRIHANDRRFKCEHCGQAFVQKCSWKMHMRTKHGEHM